jgi:riboflavin synthase
MFTGIIQAIGTVQAMEPRGDDKRIAIEAGKLDLARVALGDSIAVSGVCLTVVERRGQIFYADVSLETLARTTLGDLTPGTRVNLEPALTLSDRLGGHLVSGHVDGVGTVHAVSDAGRSRRFDVQVPGALARYIAPKGSVCMNGVSLTVNAIADNIFSLNIVPHTLSETTLDDYRVGTRVNIEVDLIARYLERLLLGQVEGKEREAALTRAFLADHGFLK